MRKLILAMLLSVVATSLYAFEISDIRALAEQGFAPAQYSMGIAYDTGKDVPVNHTEAVKWYRLAAYQGHARAQNNLAASYGRGEGVAQNYGQAMKWYRKAERQGDALARSNLASVHN